MSSVLKEVPPNGTEREIDGKPCVFYDGYWIRSYHLNKDSFADKKVMIDMLTRRVFHHVEPGINTPSNRLDQVRAIYEAEDNPARKRVKGAMLAGSLLNRGRHILTVIVELEEAGVKIESSNELLRECGRCFMEALDLGKNIKLGDGGEGIDELWGEPFKVFTMPIEEFFKTRYIKIAQAMSEIDQVTDASRRVICEFKKFDNIKVKLSELSETTKQACETIRNDPVIFDVWPRYIAAKENYEDCMLELAVKKSDTGYPLSLDAYRLIKEGGELLVKLATLRVPIPNSVKDFTQRCNDFVAKED
ncbi:MAG: hypothetical protein HND53_06040 [Proteobacteria bacterium]|nr:hypothetical protein [Pseudomonadota bacterium]NOG60043.1 hypothetical protein [Pseudomonadota bacterium]